MVPAAIRRSARPRPGVGCGDGQRSPDRFDGRHQHDGHPPDDFVRVRNHHDNAGSGGYHGANDDNGCCCGQHGATHDDGCCCGQHGGTWAVDTDIGSFSDFTSTWVGYRVQEVLGNGIGSATAVGRTPLVVGSVVLTNDAIEAVEVTADLRGLRSDKVYRDGKVRSALHTDDHPTATFALVGPVTLGDLDGDGMSVDAVVPGTITINGMIGPVEVTLAATLVGDVVTVVGSFPIVFADHGIEAPGASIVVSVEDHGIVEFQLFLTR